MQSSPRTHRLGIVRARIFLLILLSLVAWKAPDARADAGHWTDTSNWSRGDRERYAVHMMLLRGDSNPYHSRVLWWQGEGQVFPSTITKFYGGEWGWRPLADTTVVRFPTASFDSIHVDTCGMDPFCGSHAILGDGRVLMAGGHNPFIMDYGDNRVRIFTDGAATSSGSWSVAHEMNFWRWYPTATTLRDGRALLTSGERYRQHQIFGGRRNGSAPTRFHGDSLYRFAPIPGGKWDERILPDAYGGLRPKVRYAHSAIAAEGMPPFYGQVYFGGRDSLNNALSDTWVQQIYYSDQLRRDPQYQWIQPTIAGGPPSERSDHSAVPALDTCMVIFGGLAQDSSALGDVWRLFYKPSLTPPYRWSQIATDSTPPARFGHTAIYDETYTLSGETRRRMIVFGGTSAPGQAPTDSRVWELRLDPSDLSTAAWHEMPVDELGSGQPSPRYWHTMNVDTVQRARSGITGTQHVAFMFGGKLDTGACSDTLWKLWLLRNGHVGWDRVAPPDSTLPRGRARHSAVLDTLQSGYGGRLYIYGGITASGGPADSSMYVIDLWGGKYPNWTRWSDLGVSFAGQSALLDGPQQEARTAEVYDPTPTGNTWTALTSAYMRQPTYPPVFAVPGSTGDSSRVISVNNNTTAAYFLDFPATGQGGSWNRLTNGGLDCLPQAAVLYRPDRIMVAGGQDNSSTRPTTGKTRTLDASSLANSWVNSADMVPRLNPNLVLLPTGKVLAVGGNQSNDSDGPIRRPQMWDPAGNGGAGTWTDTLATNAARLAAQPTIRGYHSSAILLPDGRVLSAGGSDNQGDTLSDQHTADIFSPPYLFESDGVTLAARPSISAKPESLGWGKYLTICVPDTAGITRVSLIRPGATTHAFDQNQRFLPLTFAKAGNPSRLLVAAPASADSAPPGSYLLFITGKGSYPDVPSIAKWVKVGVGGLDSCDVVKPTIAELNADCDPNTTNGWIISWLAPGDDGVLSASGPAAYFDMRLRSVSITSSNWRGATHIATPAPQLASTLQSISVGCSGNRYLRMATRDDNNNPAADSTNLSNEVLIYPWTSQGIDCYGGDGMMGGGGGGGGYRARRAPGFNSLQSALEPAVTENSLLPGARTNEKSLDAWRLVSGLSSAGTSYDVRVRERAGRAAALDQARLVAVDHAAGLEALSLGSGYALGERRTATHLITGAGDEVTATLAGGAVYTAVPGETLRVGLCSGGGSSPLVVEAAGGWPCALDVLVPDANAGWASRGRLFPRAGMSMLGLEAIGSDLARLVVTGKVNLQFVGSLTLASDVPTVQTAALVSANSARLGDVTTPVSGSDNVSATLVGPDTLSLSFGPPPLEAGRVRDYFLAVEATPVTAKTLAQLQRSAGAPMIPTRFALRQNRPNPFNAATTVWFDLPVGAMVRLEVFDTQGRRVQTLANRYFPPGSHAVPWNPSASGRRVGPGVYFYRLDAGAFRDRKKMTLIP